MVIDVGLLIARWLGMSAIAVGWDPLGWVHEMDWYRDLLRAEWFQGIRPTWISYRLDLVVLGVLLVLLILIFRALVRRRVRRGGRTDGRRSKALSRKTAEHYLKTGEPMMAVDAYLAADDPDAAIQILIAQQAYARAGALAEELGRLDEAADYYTQAKDSGGAIRALTAAGKIEEAVDMYRNEERVVDGAELYLKAGEPIKAGWLFREVGLFGKAATVFSEAGELLLAAECLQQLMAESRSGFTEDEAEQLLQGAASLQKAGRTRESAEMLEAAGEFEGAGLRFEEAGEKQRAAACFERVGKLRRAATVTDDPERRLLLLEKLRRRGEHVDDLEMAKALSAAGSHGRAADAFREMGDTDAAVQECLESGNLADAAALLAEKGRHTEAAGAFQDAGDLRAAREQFILAGDPQAAADMAYRSGQFFEAGEGFYSLGDLERAVEALQQVEASDEQNRTASSLLGQAFAQLGDMDMGLRMHLRATEGLSMGRDNLTLFYHMARFLESSGDETSLTKAKEIYANILTVNYAFEDVKQRHDQIP